MAQSPTGARPKRRNARTTQDPNGGDHRQQVLI